ncbi:MAG: type II secretion system protein [Kurthia sp.]|nr:type II secretion system protein [Candidatus Kurthia equi]
MSILVQEESQLNKEKGFSLIETMLALAIFSMIFLTLLPMTSELYEQMEKRKMSYHAMTVNYDATIRHKNNPNQTEGFTLIDSVRYDWEIVNDQVCSSYTEFNEKRRSCVAY